MSDPLQEIVLPQPEIGSNDNWSDENENKTQRRQLLSSHALYNPITNTIHGVDLNTNTIRWSRSVEDLFGEDDVVNDADSSSSSSKPNIVIDRLVSNYSGTVHAVTTSSGTVSLLDDSNDGRVIINRKVLPDNRSSGDIANKSTTASPKIEIHFVQRTENSDDGLGDDYGGGDGILTDKESLVVLVPGNAEATSATQKSTAILVHNIPASPEELRSPLHLSKIRLIPLTFDLSTTPEDTSTIENEAKQNANDNSVSKRGKIVDIKGVFLKNGDRIRFAVLSADHALSIHDFLLTTNIMSVVCHNLRQQVETNLDRKTVGSVALGNFYGFFLHNLSSIGPVLAFNNGFTDDVGGGVTPDNTLNFIHLPTLKTLGAISSWHELYRQASNKWNVQDGRTIQVNQIIPVKSSKLSENQSTLSLAVQWHSTHGDQDEGNAVCIIQTVLDTRKSVSKTTCRVLRAHPVLYIPLETHGGSLKSLALCCWSQNTNSFGICTLIQNNPPKTTMLERQNKVLKTSSLLDVHASSPQKESSLPKVSYSLRLFSFNSTSNLFPLIEKIAKFHAYIGLEQYNEANALCRTVVKADTCQYGSISRCYVALGQISALLEKIVSSKTTVSEEELSRCTDQLKTGAVASPSGIGMACLLEAVTQISVWASSQSTYINELPLKTPRRLVQSALAVIQEIHSGLGSTESDCLLLLKQTRKALERQLMALRALEKAALTFKWNTEKTITFAPFATSIFDLFQSLVKLDTYQNADYILCMAQEYVSVESLVDTIVRLSNVKNFDLNRILAWIADIIVPRVSGVQDPRWIRLSEWARDMARILDECIENDAVDNNLDTKGISDAILLLQAIENCSSELLARPFIQASSAGQAPVERVSENSFLSGHNNPNPTIVDAQMLSSMQRSLSDHGADSDATNIIRTELEKAHAILDARKFGLPRRLCSLRSFQGPHFVATELLRNLVNNSNVHDLSRKAQIDAIIKKNLAPYCKDHVVDVNKVLLFYVGDRLEECLGIFNQIDRKSSTSLKLQENDTDELALVRQELRPCFSILLEVIRLCETTDSLLTKGKLVLQLIRTARMLPAELTSVKNESFNIENLAQKMINECKKQQQMQVASELEEALRLLQIDNILCYYCGLEAREWFNVGDQDHGVALIRHVGRFIDEPDMVNHIWLLCTAFMNCDKMSIFAEILERVMTQKWNGKDKIRALLRHIMEHDARICHGVAFHAFEVGMKRIGKYATSWHDDGTGNEAIERCKLHAITSCTNALAIAEVMKEVCREHEQDSSSSYIPHKEEFDEWESKRQILRRIQWLQQKGIFLSIHSLCQEREVEQILADLLEPVIKEMVNSFPTHERATDRSRWIQKHLAVARQACDTLCPAHDRSCGFWWRAVSEAACKIVETSTDDKGLQEFLIASGILEESASAVSASSTESTSYAIAHISEELVNRAWRLVHQLESSSGYGSDVEMHMSSGEGRSVDDLLRPMSLVVKAATLIENFCLVHTPDAKFLKVFNLVASIDQISQTLLRSDKGVGELLEQKRQALLQENFLVCQGDESELLTSPEAQREPTLQCRKIHPTWYVGDGLLLPPERCLKLSLREWSLCLAGQRLGAYSSKRISIKREVLELLNERGAHNLAMRMLASCASEVVGNISVRNMHERYRTKSSLIVEKMQSLFSETNKFLAERSLGGSGTGFTSGVVDSQLAVGYLFTLPLKVGFKLFKSSLPSPMNRRDFERVITLALLGQQAAHGRGTASTIEDGWRRQTKFLEQCRVYTSNAYWWNILKLYGVKFEPKEFSLPKNKASYASSLILPLISSAVWSLPLHDSLRLAIEYGAAFGVDHVFAPRKFIEFVLVDMATGSRQKKGDQDHSIFNANLHQCKSAVVDALQLIPLHIRYLALRRCLMRLEVSEGAGTDYEQFDVVFTLYRVELLILLRRNKASKAVNLTLIRQELELVDKRMDALAVLSSFFTDEKKKSRPDFSLFFPRLSTTVGACEKISSPIGVLGVRARGERKIFDPLLQLDSVFAMFPEPSTVSALSPICRALSLPAGYVHARMLCHRFCSLQSDDGDGLQPSFDDDIQPVLHRLKSARDRAELAEWCSGKLSNHEEDMFACLKYAHTYATKFSNDVEKKLSSTEDENINENPVLIGAVKRVKRIGVALSKVENVVIAKKYLTIASQHSLSRSAIAMLEKVLSAVRDIYANATEYSPETLVEKMITESSLLVATEFLCSSNSFSIGDFRELASRVHKACEALADQHSHVKLDDIIDRISRRWLVHGDEVSLSKIGLPVRSTVSQNPREDFDMSIADEEDTVDFVMDLQSVSNGSHLWTDDVGSSDNTKAEIDDPSRDDDEDAVTTKPDGTLRETLQKQNGRCCLRIAFLLSGCLLKSQEKMRSESLHTTLPLDMNKENVRTSSALNTPDTRKTSALKMTSILRDNTVHNVTEIARHLLKISFSKTNVDKTLLHETKSLTFAMRHRAFRTAIILCPADILCSIVQEKGYLSIPHAKEFRATMGRCLFASHVAMEVESLGLQLPHSDLAQLSAMHCPSYARALWRQHWQKDQIFNKGRFLYLLIELSLQDRRIDDAFLVLTMFDSMTRLRLTRTVLFSLEKVIDSDGSTTRLRSLKKSAEDERGITLLKALERCVVSILDSIESSLLSEKTCSTEKEECARLLCKLSKIIKVYDGSGLYLTDLSTFVSRLSNLAAALKKEEPVLTKHFFLCISNLTR